MVTGNRGPVTPEFEEVFASDTGVCFAVRAALRESIANATHSRPAHENRAFPSLRVEPELRQAAEQVLREGESLSSFAEQAIAESIARGLRARDEARASGEYADASAVIGRLEGMLERARKAGG